MDDSSNSDTWKICFGFENVKVKIENIEFSSESREF